MADCPRSEGRKPADNVLQSNRKDKNITQGSFPAELAGSPKRVRRRVRKELQNTGTGTKAQQALMKKLNMGFYRSTKGKEGEIWMKTQFQKYRFGYDIWGVILFLVIMLPNFLWFALPARSFRLNIIHGRFPVRL